MVLRFNRNNKGSLSIDQLGIIILVGLTVIAVLFFLFKADLRSILNNLPSWNQEQKDTTVEYYFDTNGDLVSKGNIICERDKILAQVRCPSGGISGGFLNYVEDCPVFLCEKGVCDTKSNFVVDFNSDKDHELEIDRLNNLPIGTFSFDNKGFGVLKIMDEYRLGFEGYSNIEKELPSNKIYYEAFLRGAIVSRSSSANAIICEPLKK